ncbi:extracellular matrix-binding protein ebh [Microplitis demolitor]|uniref:extracellular matrix-binding protein ebh n=1 Tax=Microplitis demolitor TaxID=69319 RepID=UPI00235B6A5A|nr:extracellular matrix-binding protein ebh [Microplitis demolitor]
MVWINLIVYLTTVIVIIIDICRNSSKAGNNKRKIDVDQKNEKTTNYPETKIITGANNLNDNKKSIEAAQIDEIPIDSSGKNNSSNMKINEEKSIIEFGQSNPEKGQTRSRLLEDAANAVAARIKAEKILSKAEMDATEAQTKAQTAVERIKSAISLLKEGKLNLVENEARAAVGPATDAITAAQAFSRENMPISPVVISEFPNDLSTDSDLVSIIATVRDNARIVDNVIEKLNSMKGIVNSSQSAAEKVITKVRFILAAADVALEHAKANAVMSEATKAQENSEAASAAIDLAKFLLKKNKLYFAEKEVQNADRYAANAITAAETFNTDENSITLVYIDELPTELSKDSDLKSIVSAAREDATEVKNAIITLMSKEAIIKSKQSDAKKAKAAIPFLQAAIKAALERHKADRLLPNFKMLASKVEQNSLAATSAIDSAKIALQTDRLDDVETEALKAERSAIQAIEEAQNFSYDKNFIRSVVIDELPDELSTDSDMKSIMSKADENAAKVREAIRTINNTEKATVMSSQSAAKKAMAAVPLLHVALQAARERKKADQLLPNVKMLASEVEQKSIAASSAIKSAMTALQNDRLDDVETEALKAESSAIEAIQVAQNFSYDQNSISSVDIDDFSNNVSEGSDLESIKSKVEEDGAEIRKTIETINLKRASIISNQSAAEKAKAAVPLLRSAAKVAIERKKADAVLFNAIEAEEQSKAASKIIKSAMSLLKDGKLDLVENKALEAINPATAAIEAAQNFSRDKNSINSLDIAELSAILSTDSDLKTIKSKADDDAVNVNAAIGTINTKEASIVSSQSAAEKAKAAVPLLRSAAKVAIERKKADAVLFNAIKAEEQSKAASKIIKSAMSLLKDGKLDLVENKALEAINLATAAIEAAQNFSRDKNSINSLDIAELSAILSTDSDLKTIKSKADDDAVNVNAAIGTINTKEASIVSSQSAAEKAKAAVPLLRSAAKVAIERKKADAVLFNAIEAEEQSKAASKIIKSAMSLLKDGELDRVENKALEAINPATAAIEAAQNFSRDKNSINSLDIAELSAILSTDSDLKTIKSKADDDAVNVNAAIGTINTKEASIVSSQSAAEKAKAAVPLLRTAAKVAIERKKADAVLFNAIKAEEQSKAASKIIKSAMSLLKDGKLDLVENKALEAINLATAAIEAAQNFSRDKNSINSLDIAELSAILSTDSDLKTIKSKADDDAVNVNAAIGTINTKEASIVSSQSAAEKAKAAVPLLRSAAKVAIERKKADAVLFNAIEAEEQSKAASKIIKSAMSLLKDGELDLVENKALEAINPATAAIEAAQNFSRDKNSINSLDIAELSAILSTDSDLKTIKSKADDDAVNVNAAIGTINTKEASIVSSQSAAEKAKAAVPLLHVALQAARERKNADKRLTNVEMLASEVEQKSIAASSAIKSAMTALQNDRLDDVETEANNAEHSATEAITAAQKLSIDTHSVRPINIDDFSANVADGSALASIKTKVEDDAAEVMKAIETINLKETSVISHKATAEKAKAAVPFLRIALQVARQRKNATERLVKAQKSAAESAENAKNAAANFSRVEKSEDPSLAESISLQADVALSFALQAIAYAQIFLSTKRLVDYAATQARKLAKQISDDYTDIKAIANKLVNESEEASNALAKLEESVNTSMHSARSTQTEASKLVEI